MFGDFQQLVNSAISIVPRPAWCVTLLVQSVFCAALIAPRNVQANDRPIVSSWPRPDDSSDQRDSDPPQMDPKDQDPDYAEIAASDGINMQEPSAGEMLLLLERLKMMKVTDAQMLRVFEFMHDNPSTEVLDFVSKILLDELRTDFSNFELVKKGLLIFQNFAHEGDLKYLHNFKARLADLMEDPARAHDRPLLKKIESQLNQATKEATARSGSIRSLFSMTSNREASLFDLLNQEPPSSEMAEFHSVVSLYYNDEIRHRRKEETDIEIYSRDEIAQRLLDVMARRKDRLPLLIGGVGVGRNKVAYRLAQIIFDGKIPKSTIHQELFEGAEVLEISTETMQALNMSFGRLQNLALKVQHKYRRRIVLVVRDYDELLVKQTMMGPQLDVDAVQQAVIISNELEVVKKDDFGTENSYGYVPTVFTMRSPVFSEMVEEYLKNEMPGKYEIINAPELNEADLVKILNDQWLPVYSERYGVKIDPASLELAVKNAQRIFPDDPRLHAAIKVLQDVAIAETRKEDGKMTVSRRSVSEFIGKRLGVPVDPSDAVALQKYKQDLKDALYQEVIGQPRMVSDVVDLFVSLFQDPARPVRSGMIMGPTGVGKSLLAAKLAGLAFGNSAAVLEIKGNAIQEKEQLWSYFGAANGYISSNQTKGVVCDWLDDPGRGKFGGILIVDEAEKAHPDFFTQMMEFLDSGKVVCGDGKTRFARNHLVLFTSNRGARVMFPPSIANWSNTEIQARLAQLDSEELKKFFLSKTGANDSKQMPIEILQRVDIYTPGAPMTRDDAISILKKTARKFQSLAERNDDLKLLISESFMTHLIDSRDYKSIGIRPIEREFEALLTQIKNEILYQIQTSGGGKSVEISIIDEKTGARLSVRRGGQEMNLRSEQVPTLPNSEIRDPLNDPRFLALVERLRNDLESEVFGQEDTLKSVASAVIAHRSDAGSAKRPLSILMVGTTGSGKTEIGKALAQVLYGAKERASVVSFSGVNHEIDLVKILGAPGYDMGLFEQALIGSPDGGVIVMDEFSNMGGNDPRQKNALLKKFYEMLEEGVWTSPVTGKTYPLAKFTFLWTGNDGETLFQGDTADDTRLATWKEYRSREKLHKILIEAGIPEAFLGRMADLILMKPSTQEVMTRVVNKFLKPVIERFETQGLKIHVDEDFAAQTAFSFFVNHKGARSLRDLIDIRLRGQLAATAIETKRKVGDLDGLTFSLKMKDTMVRTRAYSMDKDGPRKVTSEISVSRGDDVLETFTEDLTEYARREFRYHVKDASVTAFHEAGHAVVNDPEQTGQRTAAITIIGGEFASGLRYLGYARYEEDLRNMGKSATRATFVHRIARAMAGQLAQSLAGYPRDAGWGNDLLQMRTLTTRYVLELGLIDGLESAVLDNSGKIEFASLSPVQKRRVYRAVDRMFRDAENLARKSLRDNWNLVLAIVRDLLRKGYITGERMETLRKDVSASELQWHIGWNFQKDQEQVRRGADENLKERMARYRHSCESFFQKKVLRRY